MLVELQMAMTRCTALVSVRISKLWTLESNVSRSPHIPGPRRILVVTVLKKWRTVPLLYKKELEMRREEPFRPRMHIRYMYTHTYNFNRLLSRLAVARNFGFFFLLKGGPGPR